MGKIFVFMGKSASGKDTIFKLIQKDLSDIFNVVSYTTRPIRDGEVNGKDYYFVDYITFQEMIKSNQVIESRSYNTIHGIWTYFTASTNIDLIHHNYMMINTLEGYQYLRQYFGEEYIVPIYIEVENGIRLQRALDREKKEKQPKYEELCRRFLADEKDFSEENLNNLGINHTFHNNHLLECVLEIETEINKILSKNKQYHI